MKWLVVALLILSSLQLFATEEPKQEPLVINGSKKLVTLDPKGKWTLEKGAEPEEVYAVLLGEVQKLSQKLQQCEAPKPTPKVKPAKPTAP